jgi:hypothetical protein
MYPFELRLNISTEFVVLLFELLGCWKLISAPVVADLESWNRDFSRLELLYVSMAEVTALCTKTRRTGIDVATIVKEESAANQMTELYASSGTCQRLYLLRTRPDNLTRHVLGREELNVSGTNN